MRTHRQIIADAGVEIVQKSIGDAVSSRTVRAWKDRDSIPSPYWQTLVGHGYASLEELAASAASRLTAEAA